jgi:nicotinate-nucleotide pyrophosphorylase (carboxylating)
MNKEQLWPIIERAIEEDVGHGDVTSLWILPTNVIARGRLVARNGGILAGIEVAEQVFSRVNPLIGFSPLKSDGEAIQEGDELATVVGPAVSVFTAERTALNFAQRMSGIATLTRQYVEAVQGTEAIILSTRQTAPGLRVVDQAAVQIGGGGIHHAQLDDMVFIRDSHIAITGGIAAAMEQIRQRNTDLQIVVEVQTWEELDQALPLMPDRITLNEMSADDIRDAVKWVAGRVPLEVSGAITLDNVRAIAETGVDYISVSSLTQWVKPLYISLKMQ